jgi:hypothetical protein
MTQTTSLTSSLPVVSTVEALKVVMAEYCNGPRTKDASNVRMVRAEALTAEESKILSQYVVSDVFFGFIDPNIPGMLEELIGLVEAMSDDVIFTTIAGKSYTATRNIHNRDKSESVIGSPKKPGSYVSIMVMGKWVTIPTDPLTMDWTGQAKSMQHRVDSMLRAKAANPELVLPLVFTSFGMPPQLGDYTDKAKKRSKKDDNKCDANMLPVDWIQLVNLHVSGMTTEPGKRMKERSEVLSIQSKTTETIARRFSGQDYYPTGAKQTALEELETLDLCGTVEVEGFESETVSMPSQEMNGLSYLVSKVVAMGRSQSGKVDAPWTQLFSPAVVASGLVLASNDEAFVNAAIDGIYEPLPEDTIEEKTEKRLQAKASVISPTAPVNIDFELADKVLTLLSQSTPVEGGGPLGNVLHQLSKQKDKKYDAKGRKYDYKPSSIAAMSAFVQVVKNIREGDMESSVNTTYTKIRGSDDYSPAYRCFGGRDIGFVSTKG